MIMLPLSMRYKVPYELRRAKGVILKAGAGIALLLLGFLAGNQFSTKEPPSELVTTETARWEWVYRQMRADRRWYLIRLEVASSALKYRRVPSGVAQSESFKARGRTFPVVAVPRAFERFLHKNGITYLDPQSLPDSFFSKMSEKMKSVHREDFLWVPDLSRHQSRFFQQ